MAARQTSLFARLTVMTVVLSLAPPVLAQAPSVEDCDEHVRASPTDPGSYYCYVEAAQAGGRFADAIRRLESILAVDSERHRARLNLAVLQMDLGRDEAEKTFRTAIDGMEKAKDAWGVVYGCGGLAGLLGTRGRFEEAEPYLERALEVAEDSDDPIMLAHARTQAAGYSNNRLDYGKALRLYRRAEAAVFPDGPAYLQSWILSGLGKAYWALGELDRAMATYRAEAEVLSRTGDRYNEASVRYNIAYIAERLFARGTIDRATCIDLAREAVESAAVARNGIPEGAARLVLARWLPPGEAIAELRRAEARLREVGGFEYLLLARFALAQREFRRGPEHRAAAARLLNDAIRDARGVRDRSTEARGLALRAALLFESDAEHQAVVDAMLETIDAVERIRDLQPERSIRARSFGEWAFAYYRLAGYLMRELPRSAIPADDLELAFRTVERMRARVLLDVLDAAGVSPGETEDSLHGEREDVLEGMVAVQQRLFDPALAPSRRAALASELAGLEAEEAELRDRIARADPTFGRRRSPAYSTLEEVRELLGPDQVMLSFQVHEHTIDDPDRRYDAYGGSWVLRISEHDVRAFPIPDRPGLEERVSVYLGMFLSGAGPEARASVRLYEELLAPALEDLPPNVRRLVLAPDGILHKLPFSALRPQTAADPLGVRFEITRIPSATIWARSKGRGCAKDGPPATLGVADPALPVHGDAGDSRDADPWLEGLRLEPLRFAEREARTLARHLGGEGRLLIGKEAGERAFKREDLSRYDVLHFATHAVVDDRRSDRSALVLAQDDPGEDGLLQVREIADLDLDGQLVILSACRSASGEVMAGEGIMGLSRAFFEAGALTVVGALWPLRDDEAALLVDRFSRELGRGCSVAQAIAETRRAMISAGLPAAAWASLVVLGDGDLVVAPNGRRGRALLTALGVTIALLALGALAWSLHRRA